jgi:hypothetical protein
MKRIPAWLMAFVLAAVLETGVCGLAIAQSDQPASGDQAGSESGYQQAPGVAQLQPSEAPQPTTTQFSPVLYVTSVEVIQTATEPHEDFVLVRGLTGTIGWSQPEVVPLFVGLAADGVLDLQFIAQEPETSQQAQGFVPIEAEFPIEPGRDFKGVRVRAAANVIELTKLPGVAHSKIVAEDCGKCVGKRFAPKGTAVAGTPGVVREEDLPRDFRIIPPTKGLAGIIHNMNRLNLVLGDDDQTIEWAFWE